MPVSYLNRRRGTADGFSKSDIRRPLRPRVVIWTQDKINIFSIERGERLGTKTFEFCVYGWTAPLPRQEPLFCALGTYMCERMLPVDFYLSTAYSILVWDFQSLFHGLDAPFRPWYRWLYGFTARLCLVGLRLNLPLRVFSVEYPLKEIWRPTNAYWLSAVSWSHFI